MKRLERFVSHLLKHLRLKIRSSKYLMCLVTNASLLHRNLYTRPRIYAKFANSDTPYIHTDKLPLIETAEPVSSFVLIHLRRFSFSRATCSLLKARLFAREIGVSRWQPPFKSYAMGCMTRYFVNNFRNNIICLI